MNDVPKATNLWPALQGSWVSSDVSMSPSEQRPSEIMHFPDERTCVVEFQTDMGRVVGWFQYWPEKDGILRYPLSKTGRALFKKAERVSIRIEGTHLVINGHPCNRAEGLMLPERCDVSPGKRPDKSGQLAPWTFKSELLPYLDQSTMLSQKFESNR